ncbi:MAG: dihydrolipoamide acetyltransferase family protein [Gammaproteobacteria bacterium]
MTDTLDILAPADQTEGTRSQILRWLKAVGDTVAEHEPLIEIETDKVTVEVAAPASGVLREIMTAEQEEVAPGQILGRLELARRSTASAPRSVAHTPAAMESATAEKTEAAEVTEASEVSKAPDGRSASHVGAQPPNLAPRITPDTPMPQSPAVRRLLTDRGLDASALHGTGEGGRITIDDVLAHSSTSSSKAPVSAHPAASAETETKQPAPAPAALRSHTIPHTAMRKRIAAHMVQSLLHTAPHVTTVFEADLSGVIAHRATHRAAFESQGAPLTFTAYFVSAAATAIRSVPETNSRWTDSALEIHDDIHIGIATAIEGTGLVVPVLRNVHELDLFGIARGLNQLVNAARDGTLQPADLRGGTFTISNHGVSGSLLATPIVINQPQSAILGIGKVEKRPVAWEDGDEEHVVVRPKCYVTLTIDHRAMDGHQANRFLQTFVRTLESWPRESPQQRAAT